jgi:hypothetical protein
MGGVSDAEDRVVKEGNTGMMNLSRNPVQGKGYLVN